MSTAWPSCARCATASRDPPIATAHSAIFPPSEAPSVASASLAASSPPSGGYHRSSSPHKALHDILITRPLCLGNSARR